VVQALEYLASFETRPAEWFELSVTCNLNVSLCCTKLHDWPRAINTASTALEHICDPGEVGQKYRFKALYRRAQAYIGSKKPLNLTAAKRDLKAAFQLRPTSTLIRKDLQLLARMLDETKEERGGILDKKRENMKRAMKVIYSDKEDSSTVDRLMEKATQLRSSGSHQDAISTFQAVLGCIESGSTNYFDPLDASVFSHNCISETHSEAQAAALSGLGDSLNAEGEHAQALQAHYCCLKLAVFLANPTKKSIDSLPTSPLGELEGVELPSSVAIGRCLGNMGMTLQALNQEDTALVFFSHQLDLAKDVSDFTMQLRAQISIGSSQHALKQLDKAMEVFQVAMKMIKSEAASQPLQPDALALSMFETMVAKKVKLIEEQQAKCGAKV
jgi:tetratricopeptide (TPR) repeat protein